MEFCLWCCKAIVGVSVVGGDSFVTALGALWIEAKDFPLASTAIYISQAIGHGSTQGRGELG